MIKRLLPCLLLLVLAACSKKEVRRYPRYESFPEEKKLTARVVALDTAIFRYAYRIAVHEGVAVVMDLHNRDYFYHAFTYPDFRYLVSFGRRGEGPGDVLSAENVRYVSNDSIWTADGLQKKLYRWKLSPQNRTAELVEEIPLSKEKLGVWDFALYNGDEFFIPDHSGSSSFYRAGKQQQVLDTVGIIPTEAHPDSPARVILGQVWMRFIDYHPANHRLALVTQLGEVLEIYNTQTGAGRVVYGPNGEPVFRKEGDYALPDGIRGFSCVQVTDRYIYAVFQGQRLKDRQLQKQAGQEVLTGGNQIYVFDLEGNPVRKYTLDRFILGLYVDEANGLITAVEVNNDDPIMLFDI